MQIEWKLHSKLKLKWQIEQGSINIHDYDQMPKQEKVQKLHLIILKLMQNLYQIQFMWKKEIIM